MGGGSASMTLAAASSRTRPGTRRRWRRRPPRRRSVTWWRSRRREAEATRRATRARSPRPGGWPRCGEAVAQVQGVGQYRPGGQGVGASGDRELRQAQLLDQGVPSPPISTSRSCPHQDRPPSGSVAGQRRAGRPTDTPAAGRRPRRPAARPTCPRRRPAWPSRRGRRTGPETCSIITEHKLKTRSQKLISRVRELKRLLQSSLGIEYDSNTRESAIPGSCGGRVFRRSATSSHSVWVSSRGSRARASTGAAGRWCSRWCRAARGLGVAEVDLDPGVDLESGVLAISLPRSQVMDFRSSTGNVAIIWARLIRAISAVCRPGSGARSTNREERSTRVITAPCRCRPVAGRPPSDREPRGRRLRPAVR